MSTIGTTTSAFGTNAGMNVSVTFASNGTALVSWYDGTNIKVSYASSPYSSWTSLTINAASGMLVGQRLDVSDTVNLAFYINTGLEYAPVTLSGTTYSVGSLDQIASQATGGNSLMGCIMEKDPQSRYWVVVTNRVGSSIIAYETSTPTTAGWTSNHTIAWSSGTLNNFPAGSIVGNYLLVLYPSAASTFNYQRIDVTPSTLGAWSSATAFTPGGLSVTNNNFFSFRGHSTVGVEANDSSSGIWARVYTPATDTWASAVQLSSNASDAKPTVVAGGDGNLYVFWQAFVGSNNYAIVYKKYDVSRATWDSSPTTVVASGANNFNASGGSSSSTIGIVYQTGTASPYDINFATVTLATTTAHDTAFRGKISATAAKNTAWRGLVSRSASKHTAFRGKVGNLGTKNTAWRGLVSRSASKHTAFRGKVVGPGPTSGNAALFANGAATASFDSFRVARWPDPAILLTPASRVANTLVNWNANTPAGTALTVATSLDNGTTWSTVASPGSAISGISTAPAATYDAFAANSSGNYLSSHGTAGSNAIWNWDTANSRLSVTGGNHAVLLVNGLTVTDVDFFADFSQAQNGGLVWRYQDASNFYELVVADSANGNIYTLNKMSGGTLSQLATGAISFPTGTHHYVRVSMLGNVIVASFDGTQILTYTDGSPLTIGGIGLRNDTGTSLISQLQIQPQGQDVTGQYLCSKWTLTSTDPTATPQLLDTEVFASSSTFGIGTFIPDAKYNGSNSYLSNNLEDLKNQSLYWWSVGMVPDMVGNYPVTFADRKAIPAPWPLDENNAQVIGGQAIGDILLANLSVANSADLYRNRQTIKGAIATKTDTKSFTGDGKTRTWNVSYPLVSPPTAWTLNGNSVRFGVQDVDSGKDFYYQLGSTAITQDSSGIVLQDVDTLTISYTGSYEQDVVRDNTNFPGTVTQAMLAAITKDSGIVESIVDVSGQNMSVAAAEVYGDQLLQRYGVPGITFTFTTLRPGLAAGQQLTVYAPSAHSELVNVQMLITEVQLTEQLSPIVSGGVIYVYQVTASTGPALGSWIKLLASGLAS